MRRPWKRSRRSVAPTRPGWRLPADADPLIALGIGLVFVIWITIRAISGLEGVIQLIPAPDQAIPWADRVEEGDTSLPYALEGADELGNPMWVAETPIRVDPELEPVPARCRGCGETRNEPVIDVEWVDPGDPPYMVDGIAPLAGHVGFGWNSDGFRFHGIYIAP